MKTHIANLMDKTGCPNRVQLAMLAIRRGVTTMDRISRPGG